MSETLQPDLRCYYHPDREATSQCDRCGDFLCKRCMNEYDGQHVCATCRKIISRVLVGGDGKWATALNVVAGALVLVGLTADFAIVDRHRLTIALCSLPFSGLALMLSSRGRGAKGPAAADLLRSVGMTSAGLVAFVLTWAALYMNAPFALPRELRPWGAWGPGTTTRAAATVILLPLALGVMLVGVWRRWEALTFSCFLICSMVALVYSGFLWMALFSHVNDVVTLVMFFAGATMLGFMVVSTTRWIAAVRTNVGPLWAAGLAVVGAVLALGAYVYYWVL